MVITIRKGKPASPVAKLVDDYHDAQREVVVAHEFAGVGGQERAGAVRYEEAKARSRALREQIAVSGLPELLDPRLNLGVEALAAQLAGLPAPDVDEDAEKVGEVTIELSPEEMRDLLEAGVFAGMDVVDNWEKGDLAGAVHTLEEWAEDVAARLGIQLEDRAKNDAGPSP